MDSQVELQLSALRSTRAKIANQLAEQTADLVAAGVGTDNIVWLLAPDCGEALEATKVMPDLDRRDPDLGSLLRALLATLPPGSVPCIYIDARDGTCISENVQVDVDYLPSRGDA